MTGAQLVLATHNAGKLRELRELLRGQVPGLDVDTAVVDAASVGAPDVRETGVTFAENALLKARAVHEATGLPALADDSGLAVDVLHGAPGIFSARWAGRHGDDQANLELLLAQLGDIDAAHRGAEFRCAVALVASSPLQAADRESGVGVIEHVEEGTLRGTLLTAPRGAHGFGYDPILQPEGYKLSCAELAPAVKNAISHRGEAFRKILPAVIELLSS
ncbi:RdgB/HAM1 family non-canonical purine NTP pyrophosphatase [Psychromicrobium xiongbiense]|uniref:RdgB/HAM1 family non-canonical purine NTP pyrophosphatase n=1 Tax=Psychromicrobium xiongbiense TaxID=3051184 RepID=UPI002553E7A8|nr:RdgB/HAM1 family non-canonical purine NTP pyrophosphatase [Psychromicrobium sp. YIM S02556]